MICPNCGFDNLPGNDECVKCQQDLSQLDRPAAQDRVERSLMEDSVASLQPGDPITVLLDTSIREAIRVMLRHNIGALLVVDADNQLLGIFSERDLLVKVVGTNTDYSTLRVGDFMTRSPECLNANHTLAFALHKMDVGGYRHLPVLLEGRAAAVVSVRDMLRHITRLCREP